MRKIYLIFLCLFFLNPFRLFSQFVEGGYGIINCPGNISLITCNPSGLTVTWDEPTPLNGTILAPLYSFTQTLGPAPGETILPGFVNIQYTALYGLIPLNGPSETRTCSFTITVGYIAENYFYYDNDGDHYGDPNERIGPFCNDNSWLDFNYVYDNTDCDDNNPAAHESFSFYADNDGDHFGAGSLISGICAVDANTPPAGYSTNNTDCADNNINIHSPIAYYHDADGDGYGNPSVFTSVCSLTPPANHVTNNTDCNDGDITINPATRWVLDADNDGHYTGVIITQCTSPGSGYVVYFEVLNVGCACLIPNKQPGDCNDADISITPGLRWVLDADNDGYYAGNIVTQCTSPGIGYVIYFEILNVGCACLVPNKQPGDCDDNNPAVHSTFSFYADSDGDHFGVGSLISGICAIDANTPPAGYSTNGTDCNDNAPLLWHLVTFYTDQDHDGYDAGSNSGCAGLIDPFSLYLAGLSLTTNGSDCDDNNAAVNPTTLWYKDADNDGYSSGATQTQCVRPTGYRLLSELVAISGDCNDNNPGINPAAAEVCKNNIDDNCNGQVDDKAACEKCINADNLNTTNITSTSAQFNWSAIANPEQWRIQYKSTKPNSKWVAAPLLAGTIRSVNISSLLANQNYSWQIGAKCNGTWTTYSDNVSFKTLANGATGNRLTNSTINSIKGTTLNTSTLSLYPNPSRGQFMLGLRLDDKINATAKIQLIDMTGKTVQIQNAEIHGGTLQKTIKLSSALPKGIYLVRIIVNDKVYKTNLVYEE